MLYVRRYESRGKAQIVPPVWQRWDIGMHHGVESSTTQTEGQSLPRLHNSRPSHTSVKHPHRSAPERLSIHSYPPPAAKGTPKRGGGRPLAQRRTHRRWNPNTGYPLSVGTASPSHYPAESNTPASVSADPRPPSAPFATLRPRSNAASHRPVPPAAASQTHSRSTPTRRDAGRQTRACSQG